MPATSPTSPAPGLHTGVLPWIGLVVGIAVQFADVILAKTVFDVVLNRTEAISWMVALSISLAASLAAVWAGRARAAGSGDRWLSVGVWAGIGLAIFFVRFCANSLGDDSLTPAGDKVMAVLMGALYVATGTACAHSGEILFDPARAQYRGAGRRAKRLRSELTEKEAVYTRLASALDTTRTERRTYLTSRAQQVHATADALEARLKDYSRQRILSQMSASTAAPLVRSPHQPQPDPERVGTQAAGAPGTTSI